MELGAIFGKRSDGRLFQAVASAGFWPEFREGDVVFYEKIRKAELIRSGDLILVADEAHGVQVWRVMEMKDGQPVPENLRGLVLGYFRGR